MNMFLNIYIDLSPLRHFLLLWRSKFPYFHFPWIFPDGSDGKVSLYNVGDLGSIPGSGRFPGERNGNPLQYSYLENPMDGGAWCRLLSMGLQRVGHDWATSPLSFIFLRLKIFCYLFYCQSVIDILFNFLLFENVFILP